MLISALPLGVQGDGFQAPTGVKGNILGQGGLMPGVSMLDLQGLKDAQCCPGQQGLHLADASRKGTGLMATHAPAPLQTCRQLAGCTQDGCPGPACRAASCALDRAQDVTVGLAATFWRVPLSPPTPPAKAERHRARSDGACSEAWGRGASPTAHKFPQAHLFESPRDKPQPGSQAWAITPPLTRTPSFYSTPKGTQPTPSIT